MDNKPIEVLQLAFKSRRLLLFVNRTDTPVVIGTMVIVSVDRGEDMGKVIAKFPPDENYLEQVDGAFLRLSLEQDLETFKINREFEKEVLEYCTERVKVRSLDMRLTDCEAQFDRNKIRVFFTADQRTDFRGLVRDLASAFRARIEMRQIGVRDDAKYKDGVGICGRQLCCAKYLNEFKSVTLKSVRDQHLSPNPTKVSGACSRLMCCLEYETDFYRKASKAFPKTGVKIKMNDRDVQVKSSDIFKETVTIVWDDTQEESVVSIEDFHRKRTSTGEASKDNCVKECKTCNIPKPISSIGKGKEKKTVVSTNPEKTVKSNNRGRANRPRRQFKKRYDKTGDKK